MIFMGQLKRNNIIKWPIKWYDKSTKWKWLWFSGMDIYLMCVLNLCEMVTKYMPSKWPVSLSFTFHYFHHFYLFSMIGRMCVLNFSIRIDLYRIPCVHFLRNWSQFLRFPAFKMGFSINNIQQQVHTLWSLSIFRVNVHYTKDLYIASWPSEQKRMKNETMSINTKIEKNIWKKKSSKWNCIVPINSVHSSGLFHCCLLHKFMLRFLYSLTFFLGSEWRETIPRLSENRCW